MRKFITSLAAAVVISAQICAPGVLADEVEDKEVAALTEQKVDSAQEQNQGMTIYFDSSAPDENGVFKLTVSFDRVRFMLYQFAFRYNTDDIEPYNTKTGESATAFIQFAESIPHTGLTRIGEVAFPNEGLVDFTGFVLKGTPLDDTSGFTWVGSEVVTGKDFVLYEFTFRKKNDKPIHFEIAFADGLGVHYDMFPEGAVVMGPNVAYEAKAVFTYETSDGKETGEIVEFDSTQYSVNAALTKGERLKNTLYLQNANYACAADGVLKVIDPGNKLVFPFISEETLYFPLRVAAEHFGSQVSWDDENKKATVKTGELVFEIDAVSGIITCADRQLQFKANLKNDRLFVEADTLCKLTGTSMFDVPSSKATVFYKGEDWIQRRYAEKEALDAMQFVTSPFVKMFA